MSNTFLSRIESDLKVGQQRRSHGSLFDDLREAWATRPLRRFRGPFGWETWLALAFVFVAIEVRANTDEIALWLYHAESISEAQIDSAPATISLFGAALFALAMVASWRPILWSGQLGLTAGRVVWWRIRDWPPVALLVSLVLAVTTPVARSLIALALDAVAFGRWTVAQSRALTHALVSALATAFAALTAALVALASAFILAAQTVFAPIRAAAQFVWQAATWTVRTLLAVGGFCLAMAVLAVVLPARYAARRITAVALAIWRPIAQAAVVIWLLAVTLVVVIGAGLQTAGRTAVSLVAAAALLVLRPVQRGSTFVRLLAATFVVMLAAYLRAVGRATVALVAAAIHRIALVASMALTLVLLPVLAAGRALANAYRRVLAWLAIAGAHLLSAARTLGAYLSTAWRALVTVLVAIRDSIAGALQLCLRWASTRLSLLRAYAEGAVRALAGAALELAMTIGLPIIRALQVAYQLVTAPFIAGWRAIVFIAAVIGRGSLVLFGGLARAFAMLTAAISWPFATAARLVRTAAIAGFAALSLQYERVRRRAWRLLEPRIAEIVAGYRVIAGWLQAVGRFAWRLVELGPLFVIALIAKGSFFVASLPARATIVSADLLAAGLTRGSQMLAKEVPGMPIFSFNRNQLLWALGGIWVIGIFAIFLAPLKSALSGPDEVVVVHWTNGHMMREGLLPDMANAFNKEGHKTSDGKPIVVKVYFRGSVEIIDELLSRTTKGGPIDRSFPDPVIVTPSADHWLVHLNYEAGRDIVDLSETESIAKTWIGIVTYREMADCLGYPNKQIGYADIIALRDDPRGWASYPCAKAEWGQQPLVAYTDPLSSSTGRSSLFSLYAIGAGKKVEDLTTADVSNPQVVEYVRHFQSLVDHYLPGTLPLNTQIYQGPRYGHFFIMPEDNLIHLIDGTEKVLINGKEVSAPPLKRPVVMIYPKEGSAVHNHSASLVKADWVTDQQLEGARLWINYLHEDAQQRAFVNGGFRPSIDIPINTKINSNYGLDPTKPTVTVNPDRIEKAAAEAIINSWSEVKKPGIVTFVFDTSGSMKGDKLTQAKTGLLKAIDEMAQGNSVGLVTFGDDVQTKLAPAALTVNKYSIVNAVDKAQATGNTALYDAIKAGIQLSDAAPGGDEAIRGVVVLTDGLANRGTVRLHDLIKMTTRNEVTVRSFAGMADDAPGVDDNGRSVDKKDMIGAGMALKTVHPTLIFFVGVGADADLDIGRMLAESTNAAFQGVTEEDLAAVLEEWGKYF